MFRLEEKLAATGGDAGEREGRKQLVKQLGFIFAFLAVVRVAPVIIEKLRR